MKPLSPAGVFEDIAAAAQGLNPDGSIAFNWAATFDFNAAVPGAGAIRRQKYRRKGFPAPRPPALPSRGAGGK